jgi:hypothetical protein
MDHDLDEMPVDEMQAEMEAETLDSFRDGQPSEHQEWQDLPWGGDEGPADYDRFEGLGGFELDGMGPDSE